MADDIDRAQEVEQQHRDAAIERQRARIAQSFIARDPSMDRICIDCDGEIEPARLAAISTSRCIECARIFEQRDRQC